MKPSNSESRSAQHVAYGFFVFSAVAEACVMPYTTIYFKHLGLTATQTGILKSIQVFLSIWTLIFWVHFATRFNAYRLVIVFSVSISIIGFLCVTLLKPLDTSVYLINCPVASTLNNSSESYLIVTQTEGFKTDFYYVDVTTTETSYEVDIVAKNRYDETDYGKMNYYDDESSYPFKRIEKRSFLNSIWDSINPKPTTTTTTTTTTTKPTEDSETETKTSETDPVVYLDYASNNYDQNRKMDENISNRLTYLLLFITFMLGWIFGNPAITVADQAWYAFLDDLDLTEKYGKHRGFCLFAAGLAALISSLAVATTKCRLWFDLDHFNIHFYSYAFFMSLALFFAFCFPIVNSKFSLAMPQTSKMSEYKLLFSDLSLFLVTLTCILTGIFNSCIDDFLLWRVEDLGGNEMHFGTIVSLNMIVDIFTINTSRYLLRRFKLHPVLILSLVILSLRLLFFSFLWSPWSSIVGQFMHVFSSALSPALTSAYLSRTSDHGAYRAICTIVVPCLDLFGRTMGSCLFGFAYDTLGASVAFKVVAAVGFMWSMLLLIVYKVKLSNSKRYSKLIHVQDVDGIDDSETDEDWLDDAMKKVDVA